jgi:hypothetical protein
MKIQPILSSLLVLALFGACRTTTTDVVNDLGSFRGNVALISASGDTLSSYAGATVQIQGTQYQATSSANGDWEIDNVPAGIYNILFTKPGFDTLILPQFQFSGAGTTFLMSNAIQKIPMDSLVFTLNNTGTQVITGYDNKGNPIYEYEGSLAVQGHTSGPDTGIQPCTVAYTYSAPFSNLSSQDFVYLINDSLPPLEESIRYSEPPVTSGTVITVQTSLTATQSTVTESFAHFQVASSPYHSVRTYSLP